MYKDICNFFLYLPFLLYVLAHSGFILFLKIFSIDLTIIWGQLIIQAVLLLSVGISLSLNNKKVNIIGVILIFINDVYHISIGYYDSLTNMKFDTLKPAIYFSLGITVYYLFVFLIKNILFGKIKISQNN